MAHVAFQETAEEQKLVWCRMPTEVLPSRIARRWRSAQEDLARIEKVHLEIIHLRRALQEVRSRASLRLRQAYGFSMLAVLIIVLEMVAFHLI